MAPSPKINMAESDLDNEFHNLNLTTTRKHIKTQAVVMDQS